MRQGSVVINRDPRQVTEPHLGTYATADLVLTVVDERVRFTPVGRRVIGGEGRVDVRGEIGESMFVVQPGPEWVIVTSGYPNLRSEPLDEFTFGELLEAIMRR